MNDIIKMVELPEKLGILLDGAIKTVKHEIKEEECVFLSTMMAHMAASLKAPMFSALIKPLASSLINAITGEQEKDKRRISSIISIASNDESYDRKMI